MTMHTTLPTCRPPTELSLPSLSSLASLLVRRAWIIGACFLVALLLAAFYLLATTPRFESVSVLQVEQRAQSVYTSADKGTQAEASDSDDTEIKTIEQALQLDGLFKSVVTDPAVLADPAFLPGFEKPSQNLSPEELADKLKKATTVKLRHGTRLIDVTVDHPNPGTAQLLNSTLINDFILENGRAQTDTDKMAVDFLQGEAVRFKTDLQHAQDALQVYRETLLIKDRITDQQKEVDDLVQRYRDKHPKLIEARAQLADLQTTFDAAIHKVISESPTESAYWSATVKNLLSENTADRVQDELKLVEARTNVLQSESDTQSALFANVLRQMRDAGVNKEMAPIVVDVIEHATLPIKPSKPRKLLILVLAGILGLAAGVSGVLSLHGMDSSLKSGTDVEQYLGLPILGMLPIVKGALPPTKRGARNPDAADSRATLAVLTDPKGSAAENFRSLCVAVSLLGREKNHRVILFSSALAEEGKTFTSSNYAISLAQRGLKTLLIDADLRRPTVHEAFGFKNNEPGLTELISLGGKLSESVRRNVGVLNLDVLARGAESPNPSELLSGDGLKELLAEAMATYDHIVLDTPPLTAVSDSLLIAPLVQSVCLVVRSGKTPRLAAQRALHLLEMAGRRPVGVVLNCIPTNWREGSTPKYLYADHGYGKS